MAKRILMIILYTLLIIAFGITSFMYLSPEFGAKPSKTDLAYFKTLDNYSEDIFINQIETKMTMNFDSIVKLIPEYFSPVAGREPSSPPPVIKVDPAKISRHKNTRLTWFGHSAVLLEIAGKTVFLDPMLGDVPSPVSWLGKPRYNPELPIAIDNLPYLDAVLISHDHYDHLDYGTLDKIRDIVGKFYVPLGVAAHLRSWDIPEEQIVEMNWWDERKHEDLDITFTPARHFSGRGLTDRSSTLWGSWVVKSDSSQIYFSGDSGYGPHFKEIGEKFGEFDLAMIECGQYNERWQAIHMMPEESAQAAKDLGAKHIMPIHWGAFTLSLHAWTDPVDRVINAAEKLNIPVTTPIIGEFIELSSDTLPHSTWWEYDEQN